MKEYVLIAKVIGGELEIHTTNEGFDPLELVGVLEVKRADLIKQMQEACVFERTVVRENGEVVDIKESGCKVCDEEKQYPRTKNESGTSEYVADAER